MYIYILKTYIHQLYSVTGCHKENLIRVKDFDEHFAN